MTGSSSGRTAPINDIEMYFEIRGEGDPLVLLHGGGGVGANWELIFPEAPKGYRLVIPDLRGHGRTTNPAMQFTFRQSALAIGDTGESKRGGVGANATMAQTRR
jgi:pimeloyl-ACP methyl ester carboxylesterase